MADRRGNMAHEGLQIGTRHETFGTSRTKIYSSSPPFFEERLLLLLRRFGAAFFEERRLDLRLADLRLADLRLGAALRLDARRRFGAMMTFQLLRNAQK